MLAVYSTDLADWTMDTCCCGGGLTSLQKCSRYIVNIIIKILTIVWILSKIESFVHSCIHVHTHTHTHRDMLILTGISIYIHAVHICIYIFASIHVQIGAEKFSVHNSTFKRCPWCNGYRRRIWTRWPEFKSWTWLIAFHIALIPLGKVWIQLFSLQLWVNSRADKVLQPWWGN